jgi:hypothetical protein
MLKYNIQYTITMNLTTMTINNLYNNNNNDIQ